MEMIKNPHDIDDTLTAPNAQGNVWPKQCCPAFTAREDTPQGMCECWYCRYADFHLDCQRALDVGICNWPQINHKVTK